MAHQRLHHPEAEDDQLLVRSGDRLPGLPEHGVIVALDWQLAARLNWGWEAHYQSGVYLRGDEANRDHKTGGHLMLNTDSRYRALPGMTLKLSITNRLDREVETFGLYGEPDEILPRLGDDNRRFLSPVEPRGAWLGLSYRR